MNVVRDEYKISGLRTSRLKEQITLDIDGSTLDYFKSLEEANGIPYQILIILYLEDCVAKQRQIQTAWE